MLTFCLRKKICNFFQIFQCDKNQRAERFLQNLLVSTKVAASHLGLENISLASCNFTYLPCVSVFTNILSFVWHYLSNLDECEKFNEAQSWYILFGKKASASCLSFGQWIGKPSITISFFLFKTKFKRIYHPVQKQKPTLLVK